jgi:hypothetical protein
MWISPAGQIVLTDRITTTGPPIDPDAQLPDPEQLHQLEAELLREPGPDDSPPLIPPRLADDPDDSDEPPPF